MKKEKAHTEKICSLRSRASVFGTNENTSRHGLTCPETYRERKRGRESEAARNIRELLPAYKRCKSFLLRRFFFSFFFFFFFFCIPLCRARKRRKSFSAPAATQLLDTIPWKSTTSTKSRSYIDVTRL